MSNRMTVTVSDHHGIKQYNVPANIKIILYALLLILILFFGILFLYIKVLHEKIVILEHTRQTMAAQSQHALSLRNQLKTQQESCNKILNEKQIYTKMLQTKIVALSAENDRMTQAVNLDIQTPHTPSLSPVDPESTVRETLPGVPTLNTEKNTHPAPHHTNQKKVRKHQNKTQRTHPKHPQKAKARRLVKTKSKKAKKRSRQITTKKRAKAAKAGRHRTLRQAKNLPGIAMKNLGKRYIWGAVGPNVFDCSGFTSYVYRKSGLNIPRTSRAQSTFGRYVKRNQLRAGDLIFFDTAKRRRGIVNHVGIYIGGNKFIHASSAKRRVIITSLHKAFYSKRYMWARRIN